MRTAGMFLGLMASAFMILLGVAGICRAALGFVDSFFPASPTVTITRADYQQCVTVIGPPLKPQKRWSGQRTHPEIV